MEIEVIKNRYNPEIALLLLCCRVFTGSVNAGAINDFIAGTPVDWAHFYQLAAAHRIRPVLHAVFSDTGINADTGVKERLRSFCMSHTAFALKKCNESERLTALLAEQGITVKTYKGSDFAKVAYGNISLRESADIDIMINQSDLDRIIPIMEANGFMMDDTLYYRRFRKRYLSAEKEAVFNYNAEKGFMQADLHYRPSKYYMNYTGTFSEMLDDGYLLASRRFNEYDYLKLMLVNSAVADYFPDIRSVLDLAMMYQKTGNAAGNLGDIPVVYSQLSSLLIKDLLGMGAADEKAVPESVRSVSKALRERLLTMQQKQRVSFGKAFYYNIRLSENIAQKMSAVRRAIHFALTPNGRDIDSHYLPFWTLYYLSRPFRLLVKAATGKAGTNK
ncbi:nucleotidyltransferase family protein [Sediminibacterium ginsengisoli]|uniref:Uncharacterized nucleotidyltransferase n=1 Tax=Sediminibacterium ginsengisoli TaxID=413434 RepID=A0A1T4QCG9_9BACT|nr:nucleotidyltransferase family protein [Sediminibacterium ginsengisoli]SKA01493.1 Uncharacterised nucleotidyltransferase [Sediminibacterium ginsengisoli]